jgi:threonine dehydrogenase-like Zn-dependent dehydrogenase
MDSKAAVLVGPRRVELQDLPVPDELGEDEALVAVEATGLCGTDWEQYLGNLSGSVAFPVVSGHETIGRIVALGDTARQRWGLGEGSRVAVESTRPCGSCQPCQQGRWLYCSSRVIYGLTTTTNTPALSGGFAQYLVLRSNSRVYPLPEHLSTEDAVFFNPLGAGMDWGVRIAGTQPGDTVLIIGPGQRGLATLLAVRDAGARCVVVVGRGRRPWRLELARQLGATAAVNSDDTAIVPAVLEATGGTMVDRVIDTSGDLAPLQAAYELARPEATIVLGARKSGSLPFSVMTEALLSKALTLRGAYSVSEWAKVEAIRLLAAGKYELGEVHSHTIGMERLDLALRTLGGEVDPERAMHITVTPEER